MSSTEHPSATEPNLATINSKILSSGTSFPVVTLSDGTTAQTGTFATLLHNIELYDSAIVAEDFDAARKLEGEMRAAVPTLRKVGLFRLFVPEEWAAGQSPGRKYVGLVAVETDPDAVKV
ncbi:hypothetical protein HKX48_000760 [Thoreauomyces humboldtii]|nr:hypothetical protein HKX48_000760 [Thoreauomyces humboldtii]